MNAPFNHRPGTREPFAAFVCDEATAELLRPVAVELGWPSERISRGGLRNAVQSLSVSASPNILFVDLSESGDPLNDINSLAEVCEPGTVVIAAGQVNDVRLYRDLVASGIQDYLLKPFSQDQLRDALAHAQMTISAPRAVDHSADRPHLMAAVIGARGGVGASTIATSIAWLLGQRANRATALLDLDLHFGTAALALDLEPGRGLTDAIENPSRIDGLFLERAMVKANEKLAVLSAEAPINQPMTHNDGTAFVQLQEELKGAFECTVIDMPRPALVAHPHLMNSVQACVVVTEFTLAAARDTIRLLHWLKSNAPQAGVLLVANKVPASGGEVSRKEFESSIERKVDICLPFDSKVAIQAAKLGKPIAEVAKATKLGTTLAGITEQLINSADAEGDVAGPSTKSLLEKLGTLKLKLPKKAAAPVA